MSRRRLICFGIAAAAGIVAGCGGEATDTVKVSTSEKGSAGRMAKIKEKADQLQAKQKGR